MLSSIRVATACLVICICCWQCQSLQPASRPSSSESTATRKTPGSNEAVLRQAIVSTAEKQLGAPYQYAGKDPRGFDCSGLVYFVFKSHDIDLGAGSRYQAQLGKKLSSPQAALPGDLLFFTKGENQKGKINHVAIVVQTQPLQVIHSTSRGVVLDEVLSSAYWKPRLLQARDVISRH